jgi:hypothetical protein
MDESAIEPSWESAWKGYVRFGKSNAGAGEGVADIGLTCSTNVKKCFCNDIGI